MIRYDVVMDNSTEEAELEALKAKGVKFSGKPFLHDTSAVPSAAQGPSVMQATSNTQAPTLMNGSVAKPTFDQPAVAVTASPTPATIPPTSAGVPPASSVPPAPPAAQVTEKVIIKERIVEKVKSEKGDPMGILGCRALSCLGCLLPLILIVSILLIIAFKPNFIWPGVKNFLNEGITPLQYENIATTEASLPNVQNKLAKAVVGDKTLLLSEVELAAVLKPYIGGNQNVYLDIKPTHISILLNIDQKFEPLWFEMQLHIDSSSLQLQRAGFGRAALPQFAVQTLQDGIQSGLNTINLNKPGELLTKLSDTTQFEVESIQLQNDQIQVKLR